MFRCLADQSETLNGEDFELRWVAFERGRLFAVKQNTDRIKRSVYPSYGACSFTV